MTCERFLTFINLTNVFFRLSLLEKLVTNVTFEWFLSIVNWSNCPYKKSCNHKFHIWMFYFHNWLRISPSLLMWVWGFGNHKWCKSLKSRVEDMWLTCEYIDWKIVLSPSIVLQFHYYSSFQWCEMYSKEQKREN